MPVSTTKSASVSALLSKSASRSIATTKSTSTSKLKSNSTSTKSTCSASTLTVLTSTASTQSASSLIPTRRFQESFSLDVEANKKKKTNKFEDITEIKKEISEIHKSVDNSKEKNKEVKESYLNKIVQTVSKPFIETDMYPDIEKLKEETKNYLNSNDPKFLAKYITEIKKEISEIHKSVDNSKEKNKEVKESYLNKIVQTVSKPFIETDMYPDIEKLKEETKNYLNSNDPKFLAKCLEKKWNHFFKKKIHGKMLLKLRSMRGNMVVKIKSAISVNFFKRKPSKSFTPITFEYLQHKRNIYEGYWYRKPSFLLIKRNTPEKAFPNPDKVGKLLLTFAVGVIEIILDPDNGESEKDNNDNTNEDNEDVGVIYIDSNEENDINLFQMDDESEME
ncbi:hypothetical protein Glove_106g83 [Diversispora epigaea]|uniref:Uncharacterized protein n=1 Tax=Diversispora epigaea TaxID=1348612 RepID=A0A397J9J9_9GLOM|nr:hypothetical protein Glove_106g83 [Diversispora epigaea]